MPLHINLLHEEQSKIVQRKRDPLKLGTLALLVVALSFYGYYLIKKVKASSLASDKAQLETEWQKLSPKAEDAKNDQSASALAISNTATLENLINQRFYWGPLMSHIIAGLGPDIQITSLDGMVRTPEKVSLTIAGISAGKEPRAVAEKFRQSMTERLNTHYGSVTSQFNSLENSDTPLMLQGKSFITANFSIAFEITIIPNPPQK